MIRFSKITLILAGLFAFCATPLLRADPGDFLFRPMIGAVKPADARYKVALTGGGAFGVFLGSDQQHEIGLCVLYSKWNRALADATGGKTGFCDEDVMPVSINYRHYFKIVPGRVRGFAGVGAGVQHVDVDSNMGPKGYYTGNPNDPDNDPVEYHPAPGEIRCDYFTLFAQATAGVSAHIGHGIYAELGYTAMSQNGGSYTLSGGPAGKSQAARDPSGVAHFIIFSLTGSL